MSRKSPQLFAAALLCTTCHLYAIAQTAPAGQPDMQELRAFADGGSKAGQDIKWDPNFRALMQASFHQHQYFWRDHGQFPSIPDLVETFIGVPEGVTLQDNRYLTVDGCVPHDCGDRGMVWIDTASQPRTVIFIVPDRVSTGLHESGSPMHLWLFASTHLNWQKLPQPLVESVGKWFVNYHTTWANYFNLRPTLVTIVQPTGEMVDLSPALVGLNGEKPAP